MMWSRGSRERKANTHLKEFVRGWQCGKWEKGKAREGAKGGNAKMEREIKRKEQEGKRQARRLKKKAHSLVSPVIGGRRGPFPGYLIVFHCFS